MHSLLRGLKTLVPLACCRKWTKPYKLEKPNSCTQSLNLPTSVSLSLAPLLEVRLRLKHLEEMLRTETLGAR